MKKILFLLLLSLSVESFAQIVYKSDYEKATELTGVPYSISVEEVSSFVCAGKTVKCSLCTFSRRDSDEKVYGFQLDFPGLLGTWLYFNYDEIESIVSAIRLIGEDPSITYITKTANLRLKGNESKKGNVSICLPSSGSVPGDFRFYIFGESKPENLIDALEQIKDAAK